MARRWHWQWRWAWLVAALAGPPLVVFGFPGAGAQTSSGSPPAGPPPVVLAAGDIADCGTPGAQQTAALIEAQPQATVLALGDLAYEEGTREQFEQCYDPTWGRFRDRTYPATGNHEYKQPGAGPYFDYWGPRAGDRTKGYYSFDLGDWHLISLNSTCSAAGGCSRGSPMEQWLRQDLAAHRKRCIMAFWHHPRFFTPSRSPGRTKAPAVDRKLSSMWVALQEAGADVVLSGHRHTYERFARQDANGNADPNGVRQFVVGTGGGVLDTFEGPVAPNSEFRQAGKHGVLEVTLRPDGYDWRFLGVDGEVSDAGSDGCGEPVPVPAEPESADDPGEPEPSPSQPERPPAEPTPQPTPAE